MVDGEPVLFEILDTCPKVREEDTHFIFYFFYAFLFSSLSLARDRERERDFAIWVGFLLLSGLVCVFA